MKSIGRPKRKDSPVKLTVNLSGKALKKLNRISAESPSRGWFLEQLIENYEGAK